MEVLTVDSTSDEKEWDRFVETSPFSNHYQFSGWRQVLERTYRNKTVYLMAKEGETVVGVLPLALVRGFPSSPHLVSLPYLSWGGVCAEEPAVGRALTQEAWQWSGRLGARYLELHNLSEISPAEASNAAPACAMTTNTDKVTMVLELPGDADTLWDSFSSKVRNQVRKAIKSDLRVEMKEADHLDAFYQVYAENMRDLGSPVHRKQFFENLFRIFAADMRLFMVYRESEVVGGAILSVFKDTAEVPWASSRREFFRYCPNNILYWEILRHACEQGLAKFDFGRSTMDSGTYRFKKQWGATPQQLYWQYCVPEGVEPPDTAHAGRAARTMVAVWQRMPLRLANTIGPRIRGNLSA